LVPHEGWSKFIRIIAWSIAILSILDLFQTTIGILDALAVTYGESRISVLMVLEAVVLLSLSLWGALIASASLNKWILRFSTIKSNIQILMAKIIKITAIVVSVSFALNVVGVDLTTLAVFTGAMGVGIGFGLQKTVGNLFSGFFLLLDESIKPGDVIQMGRDIDGEPLVGWVIDLGARYVEIETRDGAQYLIPNEEIITNQVMNWTHQNNVVRLKARVKASLDTDLPKALELMKKVAYNPPRVLKAPKTNALLWKVGEYYYEFEIRFWIMDVKNGINNVKSDVRVEVLRAFKEHGIKVPVPQRDLYIKEAPPHLADAGLQQPTVAPTATDV